jgi:DNA primase
LTVEHAKLLARYTERVVLCLDQDQAGRQASEKAFAALVKEGLSVDVIRLPAKDPDELAAKDPAALPRLVASSVPYIDTIIDEARLDPNRSTPAGKRDIATRIFSLLAALPSNIERDAYLENVSAVLGISVVTLKEDFALYLKKSAVPSSNATAPTGAVSSANPQFSTFAIALGLLMTHPGERDLVKELLEPFHDDPWKKLYELLKGVPDDASLQSEKQWNDDDDLAGRVGILQLFCEENFGSISQNLARREIRKICKAANRDILKFKQREIIEGLKLARESGRFDEEQQLLVQFEQAMKLLKMAS